jgi:LytS/YehU family sensor histidine kinase
MCSPLAALAAMLIYLAAALPFEGHRWRGSVAILLLASLVLALFKVIIDVPLERLIRPNYPPFQMRTDWQLLQIFFNGRLLYYLLLFWLSLGIAQALDFYRKYRERELQASRLEAQLALAQLQVLKMQLQPHFLFNTLNAISALIHQDVEVADCMIARLGELLRTTLENAGTQEVSLREELEFIGPYLEIEKARLGPRLTVGFDVDPAVMDALVPNLLLQPLVENAIRHGIAPQTGTGRIEIAASREGNLLELRVRDNGRGLSSNYREGVGVRNTRARLCQLYGATQTFTLHNHPEGGVLVTVGLPFREQDEEAAQPLQEVRLKRLAD